MPTRRTRRSQAFQNSEPLLYRTRDGGKTWQKIVTGLPTSGTLAGMARFVREDPCEGACSMPGRKRACGFRLMTETTGSRYN